VKRALIVVCVFFVFHQVTGINVPFYYGPRVLAGFFQGPKSTAVGAATAGVEVTAILGAVNVIATYFGFRSIDKVGRRKLAISGYPGMTTFILVAALGVAYMTGVPRPWWSWWASRFPSPHSRQVPAREPRAWRSRR
jgi:MFS family permease